MTDIGLRKMTLLDYPGRTACTIFLSGCNLRCPFCHNASLVYSQAQGIGEDELMRFLTKRRGLLDGVCVSGGEPLLNPELPRLIGEIKSLGYLVKLDTNGTLPERLEPLLPQLDYVAMDLKSSPQRYDEACGAKVDFSIIRRSIGLIMSKAADYEFRTTLTREFHDRTTIVEAARCINGAKRYYLQKFVDSGDLVARDRHFTAFSDSEMRGFLQDIRPFADVVGLRGIDLEG